MDTWTAREDRGISSKSANVVIVRCARLGVGTIILQPADLCDEGAVRMAVWLRSVSVHHIAGYRTIRWDNLDRNLNVLLGLNGAGKSTLLQTIHMSLSFATGISKERLLSQTYPDASVELALKDELGVHERTFTFQRMNERSGPKLHDLTALAYAE